MSKTEVTIPINSIDNTERTIQQIMISKRYKQVFEEGRIMWVKGDGFFLPAKYLTFEYDEDKLVITAWVFNGLKEMHLDSGYYGALPKKQLLEIVNQIKLMVQA